MVLLRDGFEETRAILLRNYRKTGTAMEPVIASENLKVICRHPEATSLEDLLVDLHLGLEELKPSLVIIDSTSSIEHASSENGFRQFMIGVASILREHGRRALITQTLDIESGGLNVSRLTSQEADARRTSRRRSALH